MKQLISLLATGAVLTAGAINSLAQTTGPITTTTPISAQLTDWTGSLSFPQFNPALGALDSITLDFSSMISTTLTINNNAASASSGRDKTEVMITLQDAGNNLAGAGPELDILSKAYTYHLSAGGSITSGLSTASGDSGNLIYTDSAVLSEFTGYGDISLGAFTLTQSDLGNNGGNTSSSQITDASLTGTVEYTYSSPPAAAPDTASTFGLLALCLGVMPFLRRKRQWN